MSIPARSGLARLTCISPKRRIEDRLRKICLRRVKLWVPDINTLSNETVIRFFLEITSDLKAGFRGTVPHGVRLKLRCVISHNGTKIHRDYRDLRFADPHESYVLQTISPCSFFLRQHDTLEGYMLLGRLGDLVISVRFCVVQYGLRRSGS